MGSLVSKIVGFESIPKMETLFYGINIPDDFKTSDDIDKAHVYTDKEEALKVFKKYKKARFKVFKTKEEAIEYSTCTIECNAPPIVSAPQNVTVGEKANSYREPKAQDKVRLRKAIERGDELMVKSLIWENPRYLISCGDTPAILQEGSRYNGLHVAAKACNAEMCKLLLDTIGNPSYIGLLYGDDDKEGMQDRADMLLDLYLNTPDKGLNETPLHFAVKHGSLEATEVLVSYPQCVKDRRNKFRQTPKDVMCTRVTHCNASLKFEIGLLLGDHYFVPVLRSPDNVVQPTVGEPFSPKRPLVLNSSVLDPQMEIRAYAGPMSEAKAVLFRKKWKTPPRLIKGKQCQFYMQQKSVLSTVLNNYRIMDTEKGLERVGRRLAADLQVNWTEYWSFLNTFADLSSPDGLKLLEEHLKARFTHMENQVYATESECDTPNISLNESDALSPISHLCEAFKSCNLSDNDKRTTKRIKAKVKSDENKKTGPYEQFPELTDDVDTESSPMLYVEKGCQLFGKRMYDQLIRNVLQNDKGSSKSFLMLTEEVNSLQSLVSAFIDDYRFQAFDFRPLHSRVAMIIATKLKTFQNETKSEDFDCIISFLKSLFVDSVDILSSDEEDGTKNSIYRHHDMGVTLKKSKLRTSEQMKCICRFVIKYLETQCDERLDDLDDPLSCFHHWSVAEKCSCSWEAEIFSRNNRKNSSVKRKRCVKFAANISSSFVESNNTASDFTETDDQAHSDTTSESCKAVHNEDEDNLSTCGSDDYYSADSSLAQSRESLLMSSDNDEMESADEGPTVYIEGDKPTRVDVSVLHAINDCDIAAEEYPHIYRWRHQILLHSEEERESWPSPKTNHLRRPLVTRDSPLAGSPVSSRRAAVCSSVTRRLNLVD